MNGRANIVFVLSACFLVSPSLMPREKYDPFFAPRPDFYDTSSTTPDQTDESTPPSPNLVRQIGSDFKNVFARKENLVIAGVGLGAAWATSYFDEEISRSRLNATIYEEAVLHEALEPGRVLGGAAVQIGSAFAAYGFRQAVFEAGRRSAGARPRPSPNRDTNVHSSAEADGTAGKTGRLEQQVLSFRPLLGKFCHGHRLAAALRLESRATCIRIRGLHRVLAFEREQALLERRRFRRRDRHPRRSDRHGRCRQKSFRGEPDLGSNGSRRSIHVARLEPLTGSHFYPGGCFRTQVLVARQ